MKMEPSIEQPIVCSFGWSFTKTLAYRDYLCFANYTSSKCGRVKCISVEIADLIVSRPMFLRRQRFPKVAAAT